MMMVAVDFSDLAVRMFFGGLFGAAVGLLVWYVRSRKGPVDVGDGKAPPKKLNPLREVLGLGLVGLAVGAALGPGAGEGLAAVEHLPSVTTVEQFEQEVIEADMPVLVDFYATWCGPCRMLAPRIAELADEDDGRVRFVKIDIEEAPGLANSHNIRGVPSIVIYDKGREVARLVGGKSVSAYRAVLDPLVNSPKTQPAG